MGMNTVFDCASYDIGAQMLGSSARGSAVGRHDLVFRVAWVERVMTSKPRTTPPGMSTATLSATRPPITGGCARLVLALVGALAHAGAQIGAAIDAEAGAEGAGVGVERDEFRRDAVDNHVAPLPAVASSEITLW